MKKSKNSRSSIFRFIYKVIREVIDTDTTRDIVFIMIIATLCTLVLQYPIEYLEVFKGVLYISVGFYFRGKMQK